MMKLLLALFGRLFSIFSFVLFVQSLAEGLSSFGRSLRNARRRNNRKA